MGLTVVVNNRTVVHADSAGKALSLPDFCKTPAPPGPPIPVPYPDLGQSADTSTGSKTVKLDGNPIMLKNSKFKSSSGDEAGSLKGVASSTNTGVCKFANYSFDVKVEGKNVPRLADSLTNNGNAPNAANMKLLQKSLGLTDAAITVAELRYLCQIVCDEANKKAPKGQKVQRSENAANRIEKQSSHPRLRSEKSKIAKALQTIFKCRPDVMIAVSAASDAIALVIDFKWKKSRDSFRLKKSKTGKRPTRLQKRRMNKLVRKKARVKKIVVLNEKVCACD